MESRIRRTIRKLGSRPHQPALHWVPVDIFDMILEVGLIMHVMVREAWLPNGETRIQSIREPSLYKLHAFFQRESIRRGDQQVEMLGHENEGMQLQLLFFATMI